MPLFAEMNNHTFRKHHGPELLLRMAKYYHLFTDALPQSFQHLLEDGGSEMINLTIDYGSSQSEWESEEDMVQRMRLYNQLVVARGNLILPEKVTSHSHSLPTYVFINFDVVK
jgi:hypothetical protein